ncbi:MAG: hypothetical protein E7289_04925 [Lachnospiraceae bacterium]|nr:hypothetical protein [Lachnospiraceae bacterium]
MKNTSSMMSKVFKASILIYPITFLIALFCGMVIGIDSGWAMPAMSNHEIMYGWEAIASYMILIVWRFFIIYVLILIFQVSYIAVRIISKIRM